MAVRDARRALGAGCLLALAAAGPLPAVVAVAPSGDSVPERLLRLSLDFAAPADETELPPITLRASTADGGGGVIEGALLDQPLWSPDRRTLTLLLDPGRVKTGLLRHDAAGWALRPGQRVALWVGDVAVHSWLVAAGGCTVPDPGAWSIAAPRAGTGAALVVGFPGPIEAQSRALIAVADAAGRRLAGQASLVRGEREWRFVPASPWPRGALRLLVHPRLESPCGDEVGEAFEHPAADPPPPRRPFASAWFSVD